MALNKVTYVDGVTVIGATNLNDIQDNVILNAADIADLGSTKVDKVEGKGLSQNDFTDALKTKLDGIEAGAQVNPGNATTSASGLMSAADKTKLNGIANGATNVTIDNTLTQSGQAADAKVTGDELSGLKSALIETTDLSSEYTEGRVTYAEPAGYTVTPLNKTSASFAGIAVPCKKGDTFVISGTGGSSPRLWGFTTTDLKAINWSNADVTATSLSLVAEQDGYFISNVKYTGGSTYSLTVTRQITQAASTDYVAEKIVDATEIISLKSFNAKGDGTTDDTTAINNALANATGKTLIIPEGTYLFSGTLNVKSNTRIVGFGANSKLLLADSFTLTPYNWRTGDDPDPYRYPMIAIEENGHDCTLENFTLQGQEDHFFDKNCEGIYIRGNNHKVSKLTITKINYFPDNFSGRTANGVGYGIRVGESRNVIVDGCYINECGYQSIGVEDSQNVTISNNFCGDANQTGLQVHRLAKSVRLTNNTVSFSEGINNVSLTLHADVGVEMDDVHISNNSLCSGLTFIGGGETGVFITDNAITGGITANGQTKRKNIFIRGNRLGGGIGGYYENAVIAGNMITNNTGGRMISVNGTNIVCAHNIPLGTGQSTAINDVPVEQWGTNPSLS